MHVEMSRNEQDIRAVRVDDAAPAGTSPAPTEVTLSGKRGLPVLIAPYPPQSASGGGAAAASGPDMAMAFQGFLVLNEEDQDDPAAQRKKWFKEMRGWLMVLATVAASVTYQAGLNPPGGFWQGDVRDRHGNVLYHAGNPVLRDELRRRYLTFYYFNATAFITSLVIMVLLMSERFYHTEAKVVALMLTTFVDLASLVGAYIAGTTRYFSSCIYVIVITGVSFLCVIYMGEVMEEACAFFLKNLACMRNLAKLNWCPVPADVVDKALSKSEAAERVSQRRNRRPCCSCCAAPTTSDGRLDVEGQ